MNPTPIPTDPDAEPTEPGTDTPVSPNLELALQQALEAIQEKEAAMAIGDWTAFGKAEEKLKRAIQAALDAGK
jgi:uncharacterized membrane protein (UPF0182 family)